MKSVSLAVCVLFAASVHAQEPFVKDFGPRASVADTWKPNGVFHGNKRVAITVVQIPLAPVTYYQPFDYPVPAGNRFDLPDGRRWYPIRIDTWSDGLPWVRHWSYIGYTHREYTLTPYLP